MSDLRVSPHELYAELADRMAVAQSVMCFGRLLRDQRAADRTVVPFPAREV